MNANDRQFLERLSAAFRVEAAEHLQAIGAGLLDLEREQDGERRREVLATIFREAHSLKGAARAVNHAPAEAICQAIESVFAGWKRGVEARPELFDPLHEAVGELEKRIAAGDGSGAGEAAPADLLARLANLAGEPSSTDPVKRPAPRATARREPPIPTAQPQTASTEPVVRQQTPVSPEADDASLLGVKPSPVRPVSHETLRIAAFKLDALFLQAEELLSVKLAASQHADDLRALACTFEEWEKNPSQGAAGAAGAAVSTPLYQGPAAAVGPTGAETVRGAEPDFDQAAIHVVDFVHGADTRFREAASRLRSLVKAADHDQRATAGLIDALLNDAKKLLLLPFSTLLESFPRLVRDLSRSEAKEVDLELSGGEVEIDKRILEEMKDPLVHLLRNCIDHGIEKPEERIRRGKPRRGAIAIAVSQMEGNTIEMRVTDDGAGIDAAKVRDAAVRHGTLTADRASRLDDSEAIALVFQPDLSTSPVITEISGRGLGLSIVKEKAEKLGGRVEIDTRPGAGTTFRILLPVTLATFRGVLVRAAGQAFVIPTAGVEAVLRIRPPDITTIENRETIRLFGKTVALARLAEVLQLDSPGPGGHRHDPSSEALHGNSGRRDDIPDDDPWSQSPRAVRASDDVPPAEGTRDDRVRVDSATAAFLPVAVLVAGGQRVAFVVQEVMNEQEVLVKPLGRPLVRVRNIAGATVLGSGKAVPILNVADLLKSAATVSAATRQQPHSAGGPSRRKSVLVADDSITSRMLLESILESAGYDVTTAVDGVDALTTLRTGQFDLLVSDVEMPRMDGFDLTSHIRADPRLSQLPVILVTALSSPAHRERGVDAGANAYIVKSAFDQTSLLDTVSRLV